MRHSNAVFWIAGWMGIGSLAGLAQGAKLGDNPDGSRAVPVHQIKLYDEDGEVVTPDSQPAMPFSLKQTCSRCHDVDTVSCGWHFNAGKKDVPSGRVGEPWIYTDAVTGTQIPLSYRDWPGTYNPSQIGLTNWKFALEFGRHLPGGVFEETETAEPDFEAQWMKSGPLEINCLSCHEAEFEHDQAEYAAQIKKENLRWAATASSALADVSGSAKKMEDTWDYRMPDTVTDPKLIPQTPTVQYDKTRFDSDGKVFLDLRRDVPSERCYFCHSTTNLETTGESHWQQEEDVHLKAGLACVDCHRNGLDHRIARGTESDSQETGKSVLQSLTCEGCHQADKTASIPDSGRLGAPQPTHPGIPTVHFEKLACTACHSGPYPKERIGQVKTSRAHALGAHNVNKNPQALPHVYAPVLTEESHGKLATHKMIWPAFWAVRSEQDVTPLPVAYVQETAASPLKSRKSQAGDWAAFTEEEIAGVLQTLKAASVPANIPPGDPAYVTGGVIFTLDGSGALQKKEDAKAGPFVWPMAHDVRPAAQALGARSCADCHDTSAAFFFGKVNTDSPVAAIAGIVKHMVSLQKTDPTYARLFALSFVFRPMLKIVCLICAGVITLVLLTFGVKAIGAAALVFSGRTQQEV